MPEATRRSALAGLIHPGLHGAVTDEAAGVVLREQHPAAICQVNGAPDETKLAALLGALELDGEPVPRRAWCGAGVRLLWNGPGAWLAVSQQSPPGEWLATLRNAIADTDATVTDVSHGRTVLNVAGPAARELMVKGCPLDIESMIEDDTASSLHGRLTVQIHCRGKAGFDLYVYRSFGRALWEQLEEGSLEYGLQIEE